MIGNDSRSIKGNGSKMPDKLEIPMREIRKFYAKLSSDISKGYESEMNDEEIVRGLMPYYYRVIGISKYLFKGINLNRLDKVLEGNRILDGDEPSAVTIDPYHAIVYGNAMLVVQKDNINFAEPAVNHYSHQKPKTILSHLELFETRIDKGTRLPDNCMVILNTNMVKASSSFYNEFIRKHSDKIDIRVTVFNDVFIMR